MRKVFLSDFKLMSKTFAVFLFVLFFLPGSTVSAADGKRIREATEAFRSGDYLKAAEGFQEAEQSSPNDLRLAFNLGSSLAAAGKSDEAVESLKKSALSPNKKLASDSLNLLGQIAVDRVKRLLADPPEATSPEQRDAVLEKLQVAERYYTEVLSIDPGNSVSLSSVELIRAWRTRIEKLWNLTDRKKKRLKETLERLQGLENWQENLGRKLVGKISKPISPKEFQLIYRTAEDQNRLTEEIAALQDDFKKELEQSRSNPSHPNGSSKTDENSAHDNRALESIVEELQRLKESSETARQELRNFQTDEARQTIDKNSNGIARLRMNLAPFEMIVREAERLQDKLCNENIENAEKTAQNQNPDQNRSEPDDEQLRNPAELSLRQGRIGAWMPLMVFRAKEALQHLEENAAATQNPINGQPLPENQKKAFELAVEYGPTIQDLAQQAAEKLRTNQTSEARPDQEEALRLLREILLSTDQQNQNQQQKQDDSGQEQDQRQQSQQQNQSNGKDENQKDQDQKNQQDSQQNNQQEQSGQEKQNDEDRQGNQDEKQEKKDQQNSSSPRQKTEQLEPQSDWDSDVDSSERQEPKEKNEQENEGKLHPDQQKDLEKAERMLRQVRRKQREANEKREQFRALLRRLEPVEKDW